MMSGASEESRTDKGAAQNGAWARKALRLRWNATKSTGKGEDERNAAKAVKDLARRKENR